MSSRARSSSVPTSTRSGCVKSWMAEPSRRNSGLEQTAKSASGRTARRRRSISRLVPTGTVDFVTITVKPSRCGASSSTAPEHVGEIGVAVAAAHRRADREEHEVGVLRPPRRGPSVKRAAQRACCARAARRGPARRSATLPALSSASRAGVLVDARDLPAELGEAGGGDEADIAGTDHADVQGFPPLWRVRRTSARGIRTHAYPRRSGAGNCGLFAPPMRSAPL